MGGTSSGSAVLRFDIEVERFCSICGCVGSGKSNVHSIMCKVNVWGKCVQRFFGRRSCGIDSRRGKIGDSHGTHLCLEAPGKPQVLEVECETLKHTVHSMLIHKLYDTTSRCIYILRLVIVSG